MKVAIICFSNNLDLQNLAKSLFVFGITKQEKVCLFGSKTMDISGLCEEDVYLFNCPKRPGISFDTFRIHEFQKIEKTLNEFAPDVIYVESLHVWSVLLIQHFRKKVCIASIHDAEPHYGGVKGAGVKALTSKTARYSKAILLRSHFEYSRFCLMKPTQASKAFFFPLIATLPKYQPYNGGDYALFFGRMSQYKGLSEFFEIARQLPQIKFVVAGKFDDPEEAVKVKTLLNVNVRNDFISEDELNHLISGSFCCLAPYKTATQSGVAQRSLCCSRPVIAFATGGLKDQIINGFNGYLAKSGNIADFVACILRMASLSEIQKNEFSKNAYSQAIKDYSIDINGPLFFQLTKEIYENSLHNKPLRKTN